MGEFLHRMAVPDWWSSLRQSLGVKLAPSERRREVRRQLKIALEIRTSDGVIYAGFSRDLSPAGMGAIASAPLKQGEIVWIKYDHPLGTGVPPRPVVRRAKVRQQHGYRFGFEFDVPLEL